jgi:glycerol-3-phosphate acyltransferase PlsY
VTSRVIAAIVGAYLIGAIPTSYLVVRLVRRVDLRATGSGNLGATNLFRLLGWRYAVPVGLFDAAKGFIPVALLGPWAGVGDLGRLGLGLMAVLGHVFSIFVGFRGGKGVATGGGVVLGLAPLAFLVSLLLWAVIVRLTGYVSLGSIVAAAALPPSAWLLYPGRRDIIWPLAALSLLVIWFHRANIQRLLAGTENRFGHRGATPTEGQA